MNIKMIVSTDTNNGIGSKGDLLFKIKDDLKRFKELTEGSVVVMGRKTFQSLPNGVLKNRTNVIFSKKFPVSKEYILYTSVENFLIGARHHPDIKDRDVYIIGGQKMYEQFMPHANTIELTLVDAKKRADTFFPKIDLDVWDKVYESETMAQGKINYKYITYQRKLPL